MENKRNKRQGYHFTAVENWLNDPNGLIYHKGQYHLFYQHYPYAPRWGQMHWGHATSTDMVNWEHLPTALFPDQPYDNAPNGGCFSGSAVVDEQDRLVLLYTGVYRGEGEENMQCQCSAASSDGVQFTKHPQNPLIAALPAEGGADFRDPKVFRHGGSWYMVVGTGHRDDGRVLLYTSQDLVSWQMKSVLFESNGEYGKICECPDLFELDGKWVLIFSPIGMQGRKSVYLVGQMDWNTGKLTVESNGENDWGFDFYAPQTFLDEQGRSIIIGWQYSWEGYPWYTPEYNRSDCTWCGFFSVPRIVTLGSNGMLQFSPVEQLAQLRLDGQTLAQTLPCANATIELADDGAELKLTANSQSVVRVQLTCGGVDSLMLEADGKQKCATITRHTKSGPQSKSVVLPSGDSLNLQMLIDTHSIEIFAQNGQSVFSCEIFVIDGARQLTVSSNDQLEQLQYWQLRRCLDVDNVT